MKKTELGVGGEATPAAPTWSTQAPRSRTDPAVLGIVPGSMVYQYEIIRELGRGGMGRVLLARDTKLGRLVAIKFLMTAAGKLAHRFLQEARTTAQLAHPHIVVVHEVGEYASVPFMVLEYLEGQPLSKLIAEGGLPWPRVVELAVPIVRALARAHEHGVVHRDMKPDNVFVTRDGEVKVLDFGIAKALSDVDDLARPHATAGGDMRLTHEGSLIGTLPYMSPEQLRAEPVDATTDLWAVGLIMWELITGRHVLDELTTESIMENAVNLDEPLPRVSEVVPDLPSELERAVEACLQKHKAQRIASASALLALLEPLARNRITRPNDVDHDPYVGLAAFQESDAGRFFGRARDTTRVIARLNERPLIAIVGPSGVGKSSFVRAGLIPALKASAERWEALTLRPGRNPIAAIATLLLPLIAKSTSAPAGADDHPALVRRLQEEPGLLGTVLRARARQTGVPCLLFIDQFEELFTLGASTEDRHTFAACVAGVADDPGAPLRVVLSMRVDFLDRITDSDRLLDEVSRGLIFLAPPDRSGLRDALIQPLELAGYRFESPAIVDEMLNTLESTPGALPLLQFVAARLWDARDRTRKLVTLEAYREMGGIAGALAGHADEVVSRMTADAQRFTRQIFQRLVTPDRTRAIVDDADLLALAPTYEEGRRAIDQLVEGRLLMVQSRGESESSSIEIVHESLISGWPRLRRWLDESQDESAFVTQLQAAAKQWDASGRSAGLLWRGDAAEQARWFAAKSTRTLAQRERAYLDAVIRLATRSTRMKRLAVGGVIATLAVLVIAAFTALTSIRSAEQAATRNATRAQADSERAKAAEETARREAEKAEAARKESDERLRAIEERDQLVARGKVDLGAANAKLETALVDAEAARRKAEEARKAAEDARKAAEAANSELRRVNASQEAELKKLRKANRPF